MKQDRICIESSCLIGFYLVYPVYFLRFSHVAASVDVAENFAADAQFTRFAVTHYAA